MNSLGTISAYSAYTSPIGSVYDTNPVSKVSEKQESSAATKTYAQNDEINDEAIISDEAKDLLAKEQAPKAAKDTQGTTDPQSTAGTKDASKVQDPATASKKQLTPEQQQEVQKLKLIDAEVKAHEQAHLAAAAGISASAPSYTYQVGPDGKNYAVGGEVSVSFSEGSNPEENIANAETMRAAALAPAEPSSQDLAVAQQAAQIIAEAQQQLAAQQEEKTAQSSAEKKASEPSDNILGVKKDTTEKSNPSNADSTTKTEEPALAYGSKKADDTTDTEKTFGPQKKDETTIAYGSKKTDDKTENADKSKLEKHSLIGSS